MTRWFAGIGVFVFALHMWWLPLQVHSPAQADADVYQQAATRLAAGEPVYGTWPRLRLDQPPGAFLYPPSALVLFRPFAHVSNTAFRWGWYVVIIGAFWALAAALARIVRREATLVNVLAAGAVLQIVPGVGPAMLLGNIDIVVWALIAWAFAAPRAAGVLLMVGGAIKIYPAILAVVLSFRASRRFRQQAGITGLWMLAFSWLALGDRIFHEWKTVGLPALREGVLASTNFSVSAQLVHIFVRDMTKPLPHPAAIFLAVFPYITVAAVAWTQRHRSVATYGAFVLTATVWAAPICWWWRLAIALTVAGAVWTREQKELLCESL